jgi:photosystem II stability/assembly factor-like uncharacterized protein
MISGPRRDLRETGAGGRAADPDGDEMKAHLKRLVKVMTLLAVLPVLAVLTAGAPAAQGDAGEEELLGAGTFSGLAWRGIGPAVASGRVSDFAVHPEKDHVYYVAVASGGVWKTVNAGTTWTPVFDGEGSYSIGCLAIDPSNPHVIWVGTGENNSQRSVSYGDGVYKSVNGGLTWEKMGLESSEHIGKVLIDPRDSRTVYVAAQGPLWNAGGDRGLFKTTDGGKNWSLLLEIGENTGVNDVVMDPRNPDVLYASAYQRRRRVWTLIDGGPESALYKSEDAGATWTKLEKGLPESDMGRIGLAVAPANPDVIYAIIEAAGDESGFYRSTDAGGSWEKMSDYVAGSPQYYNEIVADPADVDRVYSLDTFMMFTEDGGKTFGKVGGKYKHVDDHALWIDPDDPDHLLAGCDGGVYESFDRSATWEFAANLPITQFYRVGVDNDFPFYNVYGGTQDNATLGGPSRTTSGDGIANGDWFVTVFGDGFKTQVDPENPDIVYSQWQYAGLIRFDRQTGEIVDIQPQPAAGEDGLRWNWNSPLIVSPHSHTRLYFGANRIFRSDDRGNGWQPVSGDLTRQIDRNRLEVMGKVQSVDAVAKSDSTSAYGNIVSLAESPLVEGLLYAGTDDGLIQVTEDGGENWRAIELFRGVPEMTYVSDIEPSWHEPDVVYATFDNHKNGDFAPYVLKSADRGRSWTSISGDLPERSSVHTLAEDHISRGLLFAGTEFGLFFTLDGGEKWIQLKGGMPVIAVRDLEIQRRENDLVAATFGRGFYILDDYAPLRGLSESMLEEEALFFPVKSAWMYIPRHRLGISDKAFQGDGYYLAPNPPFGAVFTYYLKEEIKTREKSRQEMEKRLDEEGDTAPYPGWDALRAEDREEDPVVILTVRDETGEVVRRLTGPVEAGFHRVAWDLRYPAPDPTDIDPPTDPAPWQSPPEGPLAMPGIYTVSLSKRVDGQVTPLCAAESFEAVVLGIATLPADDRADLLVFQQQTAGLQRAVLGAQRSAEEAQTRIDHIKQALMDTPAADPGLSDRVRALETRLQDLLVDLDGDSTRSSRNAPTPPSVSARVDQIVRGHWSATSAPTRTHRDNYTIAAAAFAELLADFRSLVEVDLKGLEEEMETAGAPWTPGRVPRWAPE